MVSVERQKDDVPILDIQITEDCPAHEVELQYSPRDNDDDARILNKQITDNGAEHEVELLHTPKDIDDEAKLMHTPKDGDGSPFLGIQIAEEAPAHEVEVLYTPQDNDDDSLNSDQASLSSLSPLDKKQKRRFLGRFRQSHDDNLASSTKRQGRSLSIRRPLRLGNQNKLSPNSSSTDSTSEDSQSTNKNERSTSLSANLQKFGSERSKTGQVDDGTNMSVADKPPRRSIKSLSIASNLRRIGRGRRGRKNEEMDDEKSMHSQSSERNERSTRQTRGRSRYRENDDSDDDGSVRSSSTRRGIRSLSLKRRLTRRGRSKSRGRPKYGSKNRRHKRHVSFDDAALADDSQDNRTVKGERNLTNDEEGDDYFDYHERSRTLCMDANNVVDYWSNSCDEIFGLVFFGNKDSK